LDGVDERNSIAGKKNVITGVLWGASMKVPRFWVNEKTNRKKSNIESAAGGSKEGITVNFY